ncbi:hypothetical protein ACH41H_40680 [Streptomyces sp. NPDC020800]|uniref:hypothetical protein n=1 Tax=Streptomyces sp. NPDC020800 TaxID=3365092 RepID=UPI0037B0E1AF
MRFSWTPEPAMIRIAAGPGARPIDAIAFDGRYGSGCTTVGLRRRRVLVLGLPLWETLTADQRLALLGHDLGRTAAGGRLSGVWIEAALDALTAWADVVGPTPRQEDARQGMTDAHAMDAGAPTRRENTTVKMGEMLARPLQNLLAHGMLLLHRLLTRLNDSSAERTEYRADEAAARVASADSADGLLRALLLRESALFALEHSSRGEGDIWAGLSTSIAAVPDMERERRLRLARLRGDAAGIGRPPTCLRIQFVNKLSCSDATVVMSSEEARAMDTELLAVRASIAEDLRRWAG